MANDLKLLGVELFGSGAMILRDGCVMETRTVTGLNVPESFIDLIEKWSTHTGNAVGDILRSVLNMGLARYAETYPDAVRQLVKPMADLDAMAPDDANHLALRAVEHADGQLTLRAASHSEPDAVIVEVATQPKLAALLKYHAENADSTISEMLLECWCLDALTHYNADGNATLMRAVLAAWSEHGIPEHAREGIDKIAATLFGTESASLQ